MFLIDKETLQILSVNENATEIYGFAKDEFVSMRITDLISSEDVEIRQNSKASPQHNYFAGVRKHKKKDGSLFYVKSATKLVDFQKKKSIYLSCVDIQDEYSAALRASQATEKVKIREAYFRALIDSQSNYLLRVDLEGNFTFANRAFYQKFGFTEEEIIGQPSLSTIAEEDQEKVRVKTEECLSTPGEVVSLKIKKPDNYCQAFYIICN